MWSSQVCPVYLFFTAKGKTNNCNTTVTICDKMKVEAIMSYILRGNIFLLQKSPVSVLWLQILRGDRLFSKLVLFCSSQWKFFGVLLNSTHIMMQRLKTCSE